jgi:hypothetical protein
MATRSVSTFMSKFETAVSDLPLREAVRFTDKNVKWTSETFNVSLDAFPYPPVDFLW